MQRPRKTVLMTPGPVGVSAATLHALAEPMIFHRYADFQILFGEVTDRLTRCLGAGSEDECLIFTGSGTLANEIVLSSAFSHDRPVLIASNGDFGVRLAELLRLHNVPVIHLEFDYFSPIEAGSVVERALAESAVGVGMVALETSTGMVNPVHEVGQLLKPHGVDFFVDAVSAFGGERLSVAGSGITYCTAVPNKAVEGPPGISFASVNTTRFAQRSVKSSNGCYLDLRRYIEYAKKRQTPTTPAVSLIRALNEALKELEEETLDARHARYLGRSSRLISLFAEYDFYPVVGEPCFRSAAVTAFRLPARTDGHQLNQHLQSRGFILWFPQHYHDQNRANIMLASVMGDVNMEDIDGLGEALSEFYA